MEEVRKSNGHGGARRGAGRKPKNRPLPAPRLPGEVDAETVLKEIAGDPAQPAAARVAACKTLLAHKAAKAATPAAATPFDHPAEIVWLKREA